MTSRLLQRRGIITALLGGPPSEGGPGSGGSREGAGRPPGSDSNQGGTGAKGYTTKVTDRGQLVAKGGKTYKAVEIELVHDDKVIGKVNNTLSYTDSASPSDKVVQSRKEVERWQGKVKDKAGNDRSRYFDKKKDAIDHVLRIHQGKQTFEQPDRTGIKI